MRAFGTQQLRVRNSAPASGKKRLPPDGVDAAVTSATGTAERDAAFAMLGARYVCRIHRLAAQRR